MLERLTVRTIAVSLPLLTVGLAAGLVRLREQRRRGIDALMAATLRHLARLRRLPRDARRRAGARPSSPLLGFALVIVARVALAGSHF